ncbi:MAG: amidohydrolase family protein, partial [Planctomycetales bacterium]
MIIDAHQHFWDFDRKDQFDYQWLDQPQYAAINRTYLPDDLESLIDQVGVDRTVFVQTQHNLEENRWVLDLAGKHDFIAGVVGWIDLASPDCEEQLLEFIDHPKFVGIRHITHDEPDDDFIVREDVFRGLKLLEQQQVPFELLFFVRHLRHAAHLGRQLPNLPMVIDHIAKPEIKNQRTDNWVEHFKAAASCSNIYCKLSGMVTEADWDHWQAADLKPYVETALESFGPDRLMFGSDWPVCELAGSYHQVFNALVDAIGPISDSERDKIFGQT